MNLTNSGAMRTAERHGRTTRRLRNAAQLLFGGAALVLAVWAIFSGTLAVDLPDMWLANRPRATYVALFSVAAYCLLLRWHREDVPLRLIGYACLGVGLATLWLSTRGTDIGGGL